MSDVEVKNNSVAHRYEAWLDGKLAGFAQYAITGEAIVFTHTEVSDEFEGRGVGGALARGALNDVREGEQYGVVPLCPFIKGWIEKHPDYEDLVLKRS